MYFPLFPLCGSPVGIENLYCSAMEVDTNIHMDAMAFGMGMCCLVRTYNCMQYSILRAIRNLLSPI